MKNVKENQLKKCIIMAFDEYNKLIHDITDGLQKVEYECGILWHDHTDKAETTETYHNEDINETLSKYFDIKVTSVHTDSHHGCLGVWICYKEESYGF